MKTIIFFLILIIALGCTDSGNTDNGTHKLAKPIFVLDAIGASGYASEDSPLETVFIIDENSIEGDLPYQFAWDFGDGSEIITNAELEQIHTYKKQGIYNVKVIMTDNDYKSDEETPDESYTQELTVIAKSRVDFAIQVSQVDKILFDKGDAGKVNIRVANLGNEASTEPVKLKAFLSEDQKLDANDYEIGEEEISSLTEGESIDKEIDFIISNDIEPKNYWIITKIDSDNVYIESNEGNNTNLVNSQIEILGATGLSPDLLLESVELPEFFIVNDSFTINAKIKNQGDTATTSFSYKVILSQNEELDSPGNENNDDIPLDFQFVPDSIISGGTLDISFDATISSEGEFYIFIILDPTNDIKETDEENNVYKTEKITVGETLSGVDITPFNVVISPLTNITKGKTLSVTYSIRNRGDRPALKTNARVWMSKDEKLDENDILLPLEGGDTGEIDPIGSSLTIEKTHRVKVPENEEFIAGDYYILVDINYIIDGETEHPIEEVDYTNNITSSRKLTIEDSSGGCAKDIIIDNLEILPSPAFEGSPFTLKFDISNNGTEDIASFVTKIYSGESSVDLDDENLLKKNYNISRLSANTRLSKEIILDIPNRISESRYCVLIKADATNVVGECDEENNTVNYCFDVTTRGDDNDIIVSNVMASKDNINLDDGDKINVNFKVQNIGTTNTATFYCKAYFSPDEEFSQSNDFPVIENYTIYNILGGTEQDITDYEISIPRNMGDREYKLYINCDDTKIVPETNENNNYSSFNDFVKIKSSTSGCSADRYEINDTFNTASLIEVASDVNSVICDQDIDWYQFNLSKTHKFRIDLEQGFADKDIDLALYKLDSENNLIEVFVSESTERKEVIEKNILNVEDEGDYYLKVYPKNYSSMTKTDYTLKISYEEVGGPGIDLSLKDVNTDNINNIMTNEAFNLNFNVENLKNNDSGSFVIGIYLSSDRTISPDDTILNIITSQSLGLLENHIYENELTLTENLTSGLYNLIIKVDPYDSITETTKENNTYTKELMVNYESSCELDALEPNSLLPFLGKVVSNGTYNNLKLCYDDKDIYLIYLKKDTTFNADIYFTDDEGDIEMKLFKPNDTTASSSVASSTSASDDESIEYIAKETGFHILEIYKYSSSDNAQTYSMELSGITDGYNFINSKLNIVSEILETDENALFNYQINSESTRNLTTDISYKIYLSEDPVLDELDTEIYNEVITALNIGGKIEKTVKIRLPGGLNTGNYYFISKIDADEDITELNENDNVKIKTATILGLCQGDRFESNNSMIEADNNNSILSAGTYDNLTICPTDKDYYKIYLTTGTDLFINLYFNSSIGDLDLVLYSPTGTLLADSSSETNNEFIHYSILDSGWYFIRVDGLEYDTNAYNLEVLTPSCNGVDCNSGVCDFTENGQTICVCDEGYTGDFCDTCEMGYHGLNGECILDEVCDDNSCVEAFKESCSINDGIVVCSCNNGYDEDLDGNCIINCDSDVNSQANDTNDSCVCKDGFHDVAGTCIEDEVCGVDSCTESNKSVCNVVSGIVECSCDASFHDVNGICTEDEVCGVDSCTDTNKSVCNIVLGIVECSCDADFHDDGSNICISNTKQEDCIDNAPENATSEIIQVDVNWVNDAWETPVDCAWNCDEGFSDDGSNICIAN
jgi:subtilase family serine protease